MILVVDDEIYNIIVVKSMLAKLGYSIDEAENGVSALIKM